MKNVFHAFVVAMMVLGTACSSSDYRGPSSSGIDGQGNNQVDDGGETCPFGIGEDGFCLPPPDDETPGGGGDDDEEETPPPPTVTSLTGARSVAAGAKHSCVLMKTGSVKCFGDNTYGQLGNPSAANPSPVAVDVQGLSGVTALVAGAYHTCAVAGGVVKCWGRNNKGQLGNDTTNDSGTPVQVLDLTGVASIAAGDEHTCAVKSGTTRYGYCWGDNTYGQLAHGYTLSQLKPMEVRKARTSAGTLFYIDEVAAGARHTCFRSQNRLYCAGDNTYGQLGNDDNGTKSYPLLRVGGGLGDYGKYVTSVALGAEHSCAMVEEEDLYCWGRNNKHQLAGATTAGSSADPLRLFDSMDLVSSVRAGGNSACAVFDGELRCWGESVSSSSTLASFPYYKDILLEPVFVGPFPNLSVASVSSTTTTTTTTSSATPAAISGLGTPVNGYALGASHGCAVIGEAVKCWGGNSDKQLGNASAGSASASAVPAQRNI